MQRSPKGLITIPHKVGWDWLEEIGADQYVIRGQDPKRLLADYISFWRKFAATLIEASGKNPAHYLAIAKSDVLDRACAAARVLQQLDLVEIYLKLIERDFADHQLRLQPSLNALYAALVLASHVHQLTVVDNEVGITTRIGHRRQLEENRTGKAKQAEAKTQYLAKTADDIWNRNPYWTKTNVAKEIAKTGGNYHTIRRWIETRK